MNPGKIFETQIGKSVPEYALLYRLHDSAQSFGGSKKLRFSSKNPFDYILWDSERKILYALELKTVNDKSISFERNKDEQGKIHFHQIEGLNEWNKYDGIICGFIIEFRNVPVTIFLEIGQFNKLFELISKKSFSIADLDKLKIDYLVIPQKKARTRYTYNIDSLLSMIGQYDRYHKIKRKNMEDGA